MNYGELIGQVLRCVDDYSKKGVQISALKTADYRLKIPDAVNEILMDLATTTGKLPKEWPIVNSPVLNTMSADTSSIKNHLPGTDDIIATLTGAKAYYLEVTDSYDIYIEEQIAGVWTTLVHLTPTTATSIFTELKGLLTPSATTNSVRIRLTGNYPYRYCNHILYPYTWPTADDVQQNKAWFEQLLPADWLKFNNAMIRRDTRQWLPYAEYRLTPTHFHYNRFNVGEILVNYWRKPTAITVIDPLNPTALELAQAIDAAPDALYIVPVGVAGKILINDNPTGSAEALNYYETRKFTLAGQDGSYGLMSVQSVNGW